MNKQQLLELMINKINNKQRVVEQDFNRGHITASERDKAYRYLDDLKHDLENLLNSMTIN